MCRWRGRGDGTSKIPLSHHPISLSLVLLAWVKNSQATWSLSAKESGRAATDDLCYAATKRGESVATIIWSAPPPSLWEGEDIIAQRRCAYSEQRDSRVNTAKLLCSFFAVPTSIERAVRPIEALRRSKISTPNRSGNSSIYMLTQLSTEKHGQMTHL
jgi:hypothetical protein